MVAFQLVLQVCCYITVMPPINSYVLFAANVEDFRNLAKKFIPGELAEKLTALVSHNGGKPVINEDTNVRQNMRQRKAATINDDNRPNEPDKNSQMKFEYDDIQYTAHDKKPYIYHESTTIQNINVRKRPVRLQQKSNEGSVNVRPLIQVHVEFEDEQKSTRPKIKPTISSERKRPMLNQQEKEDDLDDKLYKKSNFESRFNNAEQKNTYVNKMNAYQSSDRPKDYSKFPHDSRYESEEFVNEAKKPKNELRAVKKKQQPQPDYDYDYETTKLVTHEEKRYRTVRNRIRSTATQDLSVMKLKETFTRATTPLFVRPEMRERVVKQRQRILPPTVATPERAYDMRQKKVTPMRKLEFGNQETNKQGRDTEMRLHNEREIRERKPQKQKAIEDDQRYVNPYLPKPTNNDYDLPYERPRPPKPTNNDYDLPYERPHLPKPAENRPSKPARNDYDLPYEKPYQSKPTKNDYDLPYEKPYPSKPIKNNYKLSHENPYPTKKNDYDLYDEKPNPSKPANNDYDLYYENPKPTTSNNKKIFLTKQTTPVKDDDYFDNDNLKPTVKVQRPAANIQRKPAQNEDIFTDSENPNVPSISNKKNGGNLPAKSPVAAKKPVAIEEEQDLYEEIVHEPVKARTENLNFDADYDNNTNRVPTTRHIMKGTGVPTRQTYRMSSPDYYKRLPRIVEKYDFSEPIPEADREREVPDDKLVIEQGRVNKKVKQQKQDAFLERNEQRPEFEPMKGENDNIDNNDNINDPQGPIMEEFSLIR